MSAKLVEFRRLKRFCGRQAVRRVRCFVANPAGVERLTEAVHAELNDFAGCKV